MNNTPRTRSIVNEIAHTSSSRTDLWTRLIQAFEIKNMAEIGVFRGDFAAQVLAHCPSIARYYMIDPWRNLEDWKKPANVDDQTFQNYLEEVERKTEFARDKRVILRGKTTEVIGEILDESLDLVYIDGDHTLKGITIDLLRSYSKVRQGGWIAGDDLTTTIWQHSLSYEPSMVFPFSVYFAEAVDMPMYALPFSQFLIEKREGATHSFTDLTGRYGDCSLRSQFNLPQVLKREFKRTVMSKIRRRRLTRAQ